jgi:hypothetical protein
VLQARDPMVAFEELVMITVVDFLGDTWGLFCKSKYRASEKGLVEVWAICYSQHIRGYSQIPLPVFTEWWP